MCHSRMGASGRAPSAELDNGSRSTLSQLATADMTSFARASKLSDMGTATGTAATRPRRRRRSPEEAEREIIEAAEGFLRERPFRELTVDEVMRRTDLSRPSFYVYFRDRHDLVLRVVQHIETELFTMSDRWYKGEGDGATLVREALDGVVSVYGRHGPVLRALSDAATDDPGIEVVYGNLVQSFIDATAEHIEREVECRGDRGDRPAADRERARAPQRALLSRRCSVASRRRRRAIACQTLAAIWTRTLYRR